MRRDQPDEADTAADGHAHADHRADADHHGQLHAPHGHAHMQRVFFAHAHGVERPRLRQNDAAAEQQCCQQCQGVLVAGGREVAHRPEGDGTQLIAGERYQQRQQRRHEHGEHNAEENQRVGGEGMVKSEGEGKEDDEGKERGEHRRTRRAAEGQERDGHAAENRKCRAERRARTHAQRRAICQRIAQQPLHGAAAQRQHCPHQRHAQHARQTGIQDDGDG